MQIATRCRGSASSASSVISELSELGASRGVAGVEVGCRQDHKTNCDLPAFDHNCGPDTQDTKIPLHN